MTETKIRSKKAQKIYQFLYSRPYEWFSPTDLGIHLFHTDYGRASSHVNSPIKKLVEMGLIERSEKGHYRAIR